MLYDYADVVVVGGGAAGIAAAVKAAERHRNVFLLERNEKPGRKILASGNGRCNLMNSGKLKYYGDSGFAASVLHQCPLSEIKRFLYFYGLILTEEDDGRIYPLSYQSASVLAVLKEAIKVSGVRLMTLTSVSEAIYDNHQFVIKSSDGKRFSCDKTIIACGGAVQPRLGGTKDGYRILHSFGHTIIHPEPALVPLETDRRSISGLSGIRVKCKITLYSEETSLHEEYGEVLFTDYGISGICVMQCARFTHGRKTYAELNLLHRAFENDTLAVEELTRKKKIFADSSPVILLEGIIPSKLSYAVLKQAGIPLSGESAGELNVSDIIRIVHTAFHYRIEITGTRGTDYAQVTSGGADCSEFDPRTMQSLIIPGLYAAGEVLNIDGDCGGFNLMFALSSGLTAGINV